MIVEHIKLITNNTMMLFQVPRVNKPVSLSLGDNCIRIIRSYINHSRNDDKEQYTPAQNQSDVYFIFFDDGTVMIQSACIGRRTRFVGKQLLFCKPVFLIPLINCLLYTSPVL